MPAVSIIMPVYNVQDYVEQAVRSVLLQSYKDFELIIVNDGTQDDSMSIIRKLSLEDQRITIIEQKNKGLSAARNTGLKAASGQYVCFIDSDDEVSLDLLTVAMNHTVDNDLDVLMYGMVIQRVDQNEEVYSQKQITLEKRVYGRQDLEHYSLNEQSVELIGYATNKLYRRELLLQHDIQFNESLPFLEDLDFNEKVLCKISTLKTVDQCLYYYKRRNRSTLIKTYQERHFELQLKGIVSREAIFKEWGIKEEEIERSIARLHMQAIRGSCSNLFHNLNGLSLNDKYHQLNSMVQYPLTSSRLDSYRTERRSELILKTIIVKEHTWLLALISATYAYYKTKHERHLDQPIKKYRSVKNLNKLMEKEPYHESQSEYQRDDLQSGKVYSADVRQFTDAADRF